MLTLSLAGLLMNITMHVPPCEHDCVVFVNGHRVCRLMQAHNGWYHWMGYSKL